MGEEQGQEPDVVDVTVVIPVFNREGQIARALRSVQQQRLVRPQAVIVVDDGSQDGSGDVAQALGATVLRLPNSGPAGARDAGMRAAGTTWIAFLDSDDTWRPDHLATLWSHRGDKRLVATSALAEGRVLGNPTRRTQHIRAVNVFRPENKVMTSCTMVVREAALAVGGFGARRHCEDLDLWIRLLEDGEGLVLPVVTVDYSQHEGQISVNVAAMREARQEVIDAFRDRPWFAGQVSRDLAAVALWDKPRETAGRRQAMQDRLAALVCNPQNLASIARVLLWRRQGRLAGRRLSAPPRPKPTAGADGPSRLSSR